MVGLSSTSLTATWPQRPRRGLTATTLVIPCLLACTPTSDSTGSYAVHDSLGIRIVESHGPAWQADEKWTLGDTPLVEIGASPNDPNEQFTTIRAVWELPDGTIAVGNMSHPPAIRVFDQDGSYIRTIGRDGDGPGEFRWIAEMWLVPPDTLIVYDVQQSRVTVVDVQGRVLGTTFFNPGADSPGLSPVILVGRFSDGTYVARPNAYLRSAEGRSGRTMLAVERRQDDGTVVDTIAVLPDVEFDTCEGGRHCRPVFGKRAAFLAHGTSYYSGMGDEYSIDEYDVSGTLVRRIRRRAAPSRVTQEMRDQYIENEVSRLYPSRASQIRRRLEETPVAETLPAFDRLFILDQAGNLWVKDYPNPGDTVASFSVFDGEGRFLGDVTMPLNFRPHAIGLNHVIGVWRDELDVESVVKFALVKPIAPAP